MKKLLITFCIAVLLYSCEKSESPEPTATPVTRVQYRVIREELLNPNSSISSFDYDTVSDPARYYVYFENQTAVKMVIPVLGFCLNQSDIDNIFHQTPVWSFYPDSIVGGSDSLTLYLIKSYYLPADSLCP